MKKNIKVLFFNNDETGVNYFRTLTPAIHFDSLYGDQFTIEINKDFNPSSEKGIEYMKGFDIIHFHQSFVPDLLLSAKIFNDLKKSNVKTIIDIDDYWKLDRSHPKYEFFKQNNISKLIEFNIISSDYVTTTNDFLKDEIKSITKRDNVFILENSIDPDKFEQFKDNKTNSHVVRIMYLGGATHFQDLLQLEGVVNMLNCDIETKNKFKFINVGWDVGKGTYDLVLKESVINKLKKNNFWNNQTIKKIKKCDGNLNNINSIPKSILEEFNGEFFDKKNRAFKLDEIPYYHYEKILSDNYRIIKDQEYLQYLKKYNKEKYDNCNGYERRWTEPSNRYAFNLNDADIVIAPLKDTKYNNMKSPLKLVECWSRRLPVVCSDVKPYNVDGVHMDNCVLIPDKINNNKYWYKYLKMLILDGELRNRIGNRLYDTFCEKYHMNTVSKKRYELYKSIIN